METNPVQETRMKTVSKFLQRIVLFGLLCVGVAYLSISLIGLWTLVNSEYVEHHPDVPEGMVGATPRSPQWPKVRSEFLRRHGKCEACGTRNDLNVHHVKPFHLYPEKELDPTNLITLCRDCHLRYGHACDAHGRVNWSCENPNVREDIRKLKQRRTPSKGIPFGLL